MLTNVACKKITQQHITINFLHPTAVLIKPKITNAHTLSDLNNLAIHFRNVIKSGQPFFIEAIPAFNTLLLEWQQQAQNNDAINFITQHTTHYFNQQKKRGIQKQKPAFLIPACYCNQCALDKHHITQQLNLSFNEVIHIHSSHIYRVQAIGFIAGFAYLGDVDPKIRLPRHKSPRVNVDKNSIAIGENKTAIYPSDSPGGWNLIAKTPIASLEKNIFNKKEPHPLLTIGQKIQFYPINHHEYSLLLKENNHA